MTELLLFSQSAYLYSPHLETLCPPTKHFVTNTYCVRARLEPLVLERWNSITVLFTRSHQCRRLVKKRPSMCYYVCVIMHVKDP